jgi:hypothetical protein
MNLFDTKNIINVFLRTGTPNDDGYLSDPALGGKLIDTYGSQYEALYKAINYDYADTYITDTGNYFYSAPRQIRFGIRIDY